MCLSCKSERKYGREVDEKNVLDNFSVQMCDACMFYTDWDFDRLKKHRLRGSRVTGNYFFRPYMNSVIFFVNISNFAINLPKM